MSTSPVDQAREEALLLHRLGRLREAQECYERLLARAPRDAETLHLLGLVHHQQGRDEQALTFLRQALALVPGMHLYLRNLAKVLQHAGRLEEAVAAYREALLMNPNNQDLLYELGTAFQARDLLDDARACYEKTLSLRPDHAEAANNLSVILRRQSRLDQARAVLEAAVQARPDYMHAWGNLGLTCRDQGHLEQARACFGRAIQLAPANAENYLHLAEVSLLLGLGPEALASYRRALQLHPDYVEALIGLGNLLRDLHQLDEALDCHRRALTLRPDLAEAQGNVAVVRLSQGLLDEALDGFEKALSLKPDSAHIHGNLLYTMLLHPRFDAAALLTAHRDWDRRHAAPLAQLPPPTGRNRDPQRRLRVGYVSPDLRNHAVGRFLLPLLTAHDPQQVEVFCYSDARDQDATTRALQTHTHWWRESRTWSDQRLADEVRADEIDILVDLTMHLRGSRLLAFARRPAPVQVTYLAYCGTTGMTAIDYRITDPFLDPPEEKGASYSERSVWIPSYWCYGIPEEAPPVNELPALSSGHITFACLNNFSKVSPESLETWARILTRVPHARLLLHAHPGSCRQRVGDALARHGVDPARCTFTANVSLADYFRHYHQADIALDCFPYAGGTTSCDALWMGVPLVTLVGRTAVGRGGVSILENVGLPQFVARSPDDYIRLAVELAGDYPRLRDLRTELRPRMRASRLMDAPHFARATEAAYRTMWREWCANAAPVSSGAP
jgi:protein O-GlcNAc transferase